MTKPLKLTAKQATFVQEYLIDLNATQAALRTGYSKKTAFRIGAENMQKPAILQEIKAAMAERAQRVSVNQDFVIRTIYETVERCRQIHPVLDRKGEQVFVETPDGQRAAAFTFDSRAVLKGCELLGRHLGLFNDKLNVNVTVQDVMAAFPEPIQKQIRETLAKRLG